MDEKERIPHKTIGDYERQDRRESGWDRGDDDIPEQVYSDEDYQCTECGEEVMVGSLCDDCAEKLS